jgi:hypothetical protein
MGKAVWRDLPDVAMSRQGTQQIETFQCELFLANAIIGSSCMARRAGFFEARAYLRLR